MPYGTDSGPDPAGPGVRGRPGPAVTWPTPAFAPDKRGQARPPSERRVRFQPSGREVHVSARLEAEHLYKVFGWRPDEAVQRRRAGGDREERRSDGTPASLIDAPSRVEPGEILVVMGL